MFYFILFFRALQPSIIFIDEVDALLSKRKDNDGGCATRLKNEFLSNMVSTGPHRMNFEVDICEILLPYLPYFYLYILQWSSM